MSETTFTFRQRAEKWGLSLAAAAVARLPYGRLKFLADALGALVWAVDARGRRVAGANIEAAFPGRFGETQKRSIVRRSYQSFARTMLVLFWSKNLGPAAFEEMDISQAENPLSGGPTIFICLHSSNFELLSLAVAAFQGPGLVVAQKLKNPLLAKIFSRMREATGHTVIPQERAMIRMFRHLKKGGTCCMVVDLNLDPREPSVIVDEFRGLKTCVTQMHAALAVRTGARIIPAECRVLPDGRYQLVHHPAIEYREGATEEEIAQKCWDALEPSIRRSPADWLWSYKHWRFKPIADLSARYPFYANIAKRFDRMLAAGKHSQIPDSASPARNGARGIPAHGF